MREEMGKIVADGGTLDTYQILLADSVQANENLWYQSSGNFPWNQGDTQKKFTTQIQRLKIYLSNRLNWLDTQFASIETLASSLGYKSAGGGVLTVRNGKVTDYAIFITVNQEPPSEPGTSTDSDDALIPKDPPKTVKPVAGDILKSTESKALFEVTSVGEKSRTILEKYQFQSSVGCDSGYRHCGWDYL